MSRDVFLQKFRQETLGFSKLDSSEEEVFQNTVLRPILKLQNDLLLECFKDYLIQHKINFVDRSNEYKMVVIENAVFKDIKFQNILKGFILGLFTSDEFLVYLANSSKFNKRIRTLLIERFKSQLQLFDTPPL